MSSDPREPRQRPASPLPAGSRPTILLAEDESNIRLLVAEVLRNEGYTVLATAGGPEALACCSAHAGSLQLLITDMKMPGMSGLELIDRILPLHPGLKTLCMSACPADDLAGRRNAIVDLLPKPFTLKGLVKKVRQILGEPTETELRNRLVG